MAAVIDPQFLWLFPAAFCASAFGGVLGMASGIFIVPLPRTPLFGLDIRAAISASIVSVIACSCASAAPLLRARLPNVRLAIVLEGATTLGALSGVWLVGCIPTAWLYVLFALILAISSWQMLGRRTVILATGPVGAGGLADRLRLHGSCSRPGIGAQHAVPRGPPAAGLGPDVRRGHDLRATGHRQRRAEDPRHGRRPAPAAEGVVRHLQLHDRRDRRRQRGRLFRARRHRHVHRPARHAGIGRRRLGRRLCHRQGIRRHAAHRICRGAGGAGHLHAVRRHGREPARVAA